MRVLVLVMSMVMAAACAAAEAPQPKPARIAPPKAPAQQEQVPTLQSPWPDVPVQQAQLPAPPAPQPVVVPAPQVTIEAPPRDVISWAWVALGGALVGLFAFKIWADRFPAVQLVKVDTKALFDDEEFKRELSVAVFQARFAMPAQTAQGDPIERLIEALQQRALPPKREMPDG